MTANSYEVREAERLAVSAAFEGGLLTLHEVTAVVSPEDFTAYGHMLAAMTRIAERGGSLDEETLRRELETHYRATGQTGNDAAEQVSGLLDVMAAEASPKSASMYAAAVKDASTRRRIESELRAICAEAETWEGDNKSLLDDVQRRLLAIDAARCDKPVRLTEIMPTYWQEFVAAYEAPRAMRGLPTGLADLDRMTQGMCGGDLWVIKAGTGQGKSVLSSNIAVAAAKVDSAAVQIFSLEMRQRQMINRMIFAEAGVSSSRYYKRNAGGGGDLTGEEWAQFKTAARNLSRLRISLYDDSGITLSQMASYCRRAKLAGECDLIIVDYAQLVTPPTTRKESNREREVAEISRTLKILASDLSVPVILVSQINDDGKLRESRALGHDASVILHLEAVYPDAIPDGSLQPYLLKVEKNRDGMRGNIELMFSPELTLFAPVDERHDDL